MRGYAANFGVYLESRLAGLWNMARNGTPAHFEIFKTTLQSSSWLSACNLLLAYQQFRTPPAPLGTCLSDIGVQGYRAVLGAPGMAVAILARVWRAPYTPLQVHDPKLEIDKRKMESAEGTSMVFPEPPEGTA